MPSHILSYGTELDELMLQELAEEARRYQLLLKRLKDLPDGEEREALEGDLYAYVVGLKVKSTNVQERLDILVDDLPNDMETLHETPSPSR